MFLGIANLQCCNYYHLSLYYSSKLQSSITILHHKLLTQEGRVLANGWNSSIIHDNMCPFIHKKCPLRSYHGDIKYHMTLNTIFSVVSKTPPSSHRQQEWSSRNSATTLYLWLSIRPRSWESEKLGWQMTLMPKHSLQTNHFKIQFHRPIPIYKKWRTSFKLRSLPAVAAPDCKMDALKLSSVPKCPTNLDFGWNENDGFQNLNSIHFDGGWWCSKIWVASLLDVRK